MLLLAIVVSVAPSSGIIVVSGILSCGIIVVRVAPGSGIIVVSGILALVLQLLVLLLALVL